LTERNGISAEKNLIIKVSDPKVIEGNFFSKSYVTYLVETKPVGFIVRRRFNDFIWLHDILKSIYINSIIPPLYKKNYLYALNDGQIAKRIRTLEKFITEIAIHPLLRNSQIFYDFISISKENEFNNKKNEYNKLKLPQKLYEHKTISGEGDTYITNDKEGYLNNIRESCLMNQVNLSQITKKL
jgi:hypothetical protein